MQRGLSSSDCSKGTFFEITTSALSLYVWLKAFAASKCRVEENLCSYFICHHGIVFLQQSQVILLGGTAGEERGCAAGYPSRNSKISFALLPPHKELV